MSSWAQLRCIDKLLPIPRPSAPHQLSQGEWRSGTGERISTEDAYRAVFDLVFAKFLCRENEIAINPTAICSEPDPTIPELSSCYINSSLGYFVITQDTAKNVNFIFHRVRRTRF